MPWFLVVVFPAYLGKTVHDPIPAGWNVSCVWNGSVGASVWGDSRFASTLPRTMGCRTPSQVVSPAIYDMHALG